jgi:phytoene dehydrogenase-like protein
MGQTVAVIGAGLAGLRCALLLKEAGIDVHIFEREHQVGGRMRTEKVDGFLLDYGFHVMQTAYPTSQRTFDFEKLEAQAFEPGAIIVQKKKNKAKFWRMADPFRRPIQGALSGMNRFASPIDLLRVARLRFSVRKGKTDRVFEGRNQDTLSYLKQQGFSQSIIERFFHPLFSGIFLEDDLRTNERMFRFVFRMMSKGNMVLPRGGIVAAPNQLAQRLGVDRIHLNSDVSIIDDTTVNINGKTKSFDAIVRAFNPNQVNEKRHVWTLHFDAEQSPLNSQHVLLNGDVKINDGLIAHLAVPSDVQPEYAPEGRSLVTITVVGERADSLGFTSALEVEDAVRKEVELWFPDTSLNWRLLAVQHIEHALPEVGSERPLLATPQIQGFECGDHMLHGSVEGALLSAEAVASAVVVHLRV